MDYVFVVLSNPPGLAKIAALFADRGFISTEA
jgi:hypothetical protein